VDGMQRLADVMQYEAKAKPDNTAHGTRQPHGPNKHEWMNHRSMYQASTPVAWEFDIGCARERTGRLHAWCLAIARQAAMRQEPDEGVRCRGTDDL
jgi:hypothetical protein